MKVIISETGVVLAEDVGRADTFLKRLKGLMFSRSLEQHKGLHITPCKQIHTCFMNYAIDVLYLNSHHSIVALEENVTPWTFGKIQKNAVSVVELPKGKINQTNTKIGHTVVFKTNPS